MAEQEPEFALSYNLVTENLVLTLYSLHLGFHRYGLRRAEWTMGRALGFLDFVKVGDALVRGCADQDVIGPSRVSVALKISTVRQKSIRALAPLTVNKLRAWLQIEPNGLYLFAGLISRLHLKLRKASGCNLQFVWAVGWEAGPDAPYILATVLWPHTPPWRSSDLTYAIDIVCPGCMTRWSK